MILKVKTDYVKQNKKYGLCGVRNETANHRLSGYKKKKLASKEKKTRQDVVRKGIHWESSERLKVRSYCKIS